MTPYDQYREYADIMAMEKGDYYNTAEFGRKLASSPVFKIIDKLEEYEEELLKHALKGLKNKKEWQDLEANNLSGVMTQMSAFALLEHYRNKIQHSYKTETWFKERIDKCDKVIAETSAWKTNSKKKANILKHWRSEKADFNRGYWKAVNKSNRYERLINKWQGICHEIKISDTAKEIEAEKHGIGNKYGFNPNMQSRETATGIFIDKEQY